MTDKIGKIEFCSLVAFLMRSIFLGGSMYGILTISNQDNWISMIIAFLVGFIPLFVYYLILSHDTKLNIVDLINKYFGKVGYLINIILILFIIIFASIVLWNLTNFISTQYLYQTPLLAIATVFMGGIIYIVFKGLKTIGRTSIILLIINTILFILAFLALISKIELSNLFPMFESGLNPILLASFICITFNILPLFTLLIIPKDNIEGNKKLVKSFLTIYVFAFISIFLVIFSTTTVFGIDLAKLYQYPEYHILKTISIGNFFERVETILSIQWIFDSIMSLTFYLYYVKTSIKQLFKFNKDKLLIVIIGALFIIISRNIFKSNTIAEIFAIKVFPYLCTFFFLLIPLLILIVIKVRKKV